MKTLTLLLALLTGFASIAADFETNYAAKAYLSLNKPATVPVADPNAKAKATENLQSASLLFIENNGQIADHEGKLHPEILFTAKAAGAQVYVTGNSIHYVFTKVERETNAKERRDPHQRDSIKSISTHRFTLELVGANTKPELVKQEANPYYENYYLAHCPNGVVAHSYEKFTLKQVYPGVDWVVYSNGQGLKYDFVLSKGSDASKIKLRVKDAGASLNAEGDLVMKTTLGEVVEDKPVSFQEGRELETSFKLLGNQTFGFAIPNANNTAPLTIDPSVVWATYFGGSDADIGNSCATDAAGNVYLAGTTWSTNFPVRVGGGFQWFHAGLQDAFLVKFNSTGSRVWATYFGGSGNDSGHSCGTDAAGNVYLAGATISTNLRVAGAFQGTLNDSRYYDAYLVKFDSTGGCLWATYYGGSNGDFGYSCATDASDNVYLAGHTLSFNFPVLGAFQGTYAGSRDAFLVKFNSTGSRLWATYLGGSDSDGGSSCGTDAAGNVYLAGYTYSTDFPVAGAFQGTSAGIDDAFLVKFNSTGSRLWATYYGGSGSDEGGCATDAAGNVYLAGYTLSTNFPVAGAFQGTNAGDRDAFLVKFNSTGSRLWATYYGGSGRDGGGCATDAAGNVYLAGNTSSTNFPVAGAFQGTNAGGGDAFLVKFTDACTPPVTPAITPSGPTTFCTGGSVTLTAPAGFSYLWSTGATSQSINVATAGTYTVQTIANGCTSVASAATVVSVNTTPATPTITAGGATTFCTGGSVILTAPAGFTYLWSNGATTQSITANTAGSYTVRTIANGCTSAVSTATVVTVNAAPATPTITASGATTFCTGGSVTLTAPAGFTYLWSNGATTQSITASTAGSYTVRTIANGCTSAVSSATVVTVNTAPTTPTITAGGATTFCTGGSVTLTAPAGFSYLWSNGATTQAITVNSTGSYTVRTISNGCTSAVSSPTVVTVNSKPVATITILGDSMVANPAGGIYRWFLNGVRISGINATRRGYRALQSGSYQVIVTINGCSDTSVATAITSLAKVSNNTTLTLHPNPASNSVQLNLSHGDIKQVEVIDQLGRTLISTKEIEHNTLDISSLANGTYMVRVLTTDGVTFKKMLKE